MRKIQTIARVLQRLLPLTLAGWCVVATAAVLGGWSRTIGRDEVANALAFCLSTLVIMLLICNYLAQFLCSRGVEGSQLLQVKLPSSVLTTLEPVETPSGWRVGSSILLKLGLITISTTWRKVDSAGQVAVRGRLSTDGQEVVVVARRGSFEFRRQLQLSDIFNLTLACVDKKEVARVSIIPPETGRLNGLNAAFPDSEEGWSQYGKRQGDYFDIQTADPQTPRRLLLWKLSLKSGSQTVKYRRAPEPVAQHRRRLGVFFQVSLADGPAAAFLHTTMGDTRSVAALFGTDWMFADSLDPGKIQPGHVVGGSAVLRRLVQSGTREIPSSSGTGEPLTSFMLRCRQQGISEMLVFHGPDWNPGSESGRTGVSFFRVVKGSTNGVNLRGLPVKPGQFEITVS
jgi:hypothetical protein